MIKPIGRFSYRNVDKIWIGTYGFGAKISGINSLHNLISPLKKDEALKTYAWDEFSSITIKDTLSTRFERGKAKLISTNLFDMSYEMETEESALTVHATMVYYISRARRIAGLTPPVIDNPLSLGVIRGLGFNEKLFKNGYPVFENIEITRCIEEESKNLDYEMNKGISGQDDISNILP